MENEWWLFNKWVSYIMFSEPRIWALEEKYQCLVDWSLQKWELMSFLVQKREGFSMYNSLQKYLYTAQKS